MNVLCLKCGLVYNFEKTTRCPRCNAIDKIKVDLELRRRLNTKDVRLR